LHEYYDKILRELDFDEFVAHVESAKKHLRFPEYSAYRTKILSQDFDDDEICDFADDAGDPLADMADLYAWLDKNYPEEPKGSTRIPGITPKELFPELLQDQQAQESAEEVAADVAADAKELFADFHDDAEEDTLPLPGVAEAWGC
jgi:hypothetical protein